jgi:hypothetical protein
MKHSNENIRNRIRDLPVRSAVPEPTALRRALFKRSNESNQPTDKIHGGKYQFEITETLDSWKLFAPKWNNCFSHTN